ncbi:unnamed protein product [Sphagnum balticum]
MEVATSIKKLSDHSPFIITIWGHHPPPSNPSHFFDVTLLSEEKHKTELLEAWSGGTQHPTNGREWPEWLEAAMRRVALCNARLAKEKRRAQGTHVKSCAKKIHLAEQQLQKDPIDVEVRNILSDTHGKLTDFFQASKVRNRHLSSATWLRYGDTCSKTFFDFHRIGKQKTLMRELESDAGTISGQLDFTHHVTNFYSRLYTSDASAPDTAKAQD